MQPALEVYQDIVAKTRDSAVPLAFAWPNGPLKMEAHKHPFSIQHREFDFIRSVITSAQLKTGFEIATAFGVSALAAALGFKETGGKLVTMDAYIEETTNDALGYRDIKMYLGSETADGFQSVSALRKHFEVTDNLTPTIGWSPDDVPSTIRKHHGDHKLDYVFIDAGHWDEALIRDLSAVLPFLGERWVTLFHDTNGFSPVAKSFVTQKLGTLWTQVPGLAGNRGGFDMAYIARDIDIAPIAARFQ